MSCEFVIALSKTFLGQTGSSSAQYFSQREFPKSDRVDLFLRLDTAKTYFETKMVICGLQNILLKLFWFEFCILMLINWHRPMLHCIFNIWHNHVWCNKKGFCAWQKIVGNCVWEVCIWARGERTCPSSSGLLSFSQSQDKQRWTKQATDYCPMEPWYNNNYGAN